MCVQYYSSPQVCTTTKTHILMNNNIRQYSAKMVTGTQYNIQYFIIEH